MTLEIGVHADSDAVATASAQGFRLAQTFIGDPQAWKGHAVDHPGGAAGLRADAEAAGVDLFIHAPYVVNVATTNNRIRIPSRKILATQVKLAAEVGARGVIVHGGHVGAGDDAQAGYDNWRKAIEGIDLEVPILIENTAGGNHAMARHLDSIARLWDTIADARGIENVGFCLDTCHAHAAGLDPDALVDAILGITGRIDLVHLNDSRDPYGSGADRHEALGRGQCDPAFLTAVVMEADTAVILETPTGSLGHRDQVTWLTSQF